MIVFSWGENLVGIWKIEVIDIKGVTGEFKKWFIRFYGICEDYRNIILVDLELCSKNCMKGC